MGVNHGLVEKSGSWYSYSGERIGQGKDNVRNYLIEHPETAAEIDAALRAKLLPTKSQRAAAAAAASEAAEG
jgi:recombination protein RecA